MLDPSLIYTPHMCGTYVLAPWINLTAPIRFTVAFTAWAFPSIQVGYMWRNKKNRAKEQD